MDNLYTHHSLDSLKSPLYYYRVEPILRQTLAQWIIAFEGCLALLLTTNTNLHKKLGIYNAQWNYLNSLFGGIVVGSYAIVLFNSFPKVVHPATHSSQAIRKEIEQLAALFIRQLLKRMQEAQPGMEGIAMLSLIENKTQISPHFATQIINEKALSIKTPSQSPILTGKKFLTI